MCVSDHTTRILGLDVVADDEADRCSRELGKKTVQFSKAKAPAYALPSH